MAKGGKMAMGGETPMFRGRGPRRPQAQGRRMPQAPGRTMPQAPGSTMPQAGNRPTVLPSGATPYNVQPRAPNSDNSEGQRGPQTESDPYLERIKQNKLTPYGNPDMMAPKREISDGPGGMIFGQRGQQPGGGGFDPRTYGSGPRTGGPGATLQQGGGQQPGGGFGFGRQAPMEDDTPKRDPRMPEFSLTGMQAAYEKGQQPGGGFSNQEQYRRAPERYVEEPMLNFEQSKAKQKAQLAEQGGVVRYSDEVLESLRLPENLKSYVLKHGGVPTEDEDYFSKAISQIQDPEAYKRDFGELPEFSPSRTGGQQSGRQEPDMPQSRSKFFNGGSQTGGCGVFSTPAPRAPRGMMAKGGSIKAKKGGSVKSKSASSRGDGCAQRGKTRGKMV